MSTDPVTFDPTMPHPMPLPWPAPWDGVVVVYDLYACERFADEAPTYMAQSRRALAAINVRAAALDAMPAGAEHDEARALWDADLAAWKRANAIHRLRCVVSRVLFPPDQERPGADPATWTRFPTRLLEWIAGTGYQAARDALWTRSAPKALPPPEPPPG